jgi:hypothetical protein
MIQQFPASGPVIIVLLAVQPASQHFEKIYGYQIILSLVCKLSSTYPAYMAPDGDCLAGRLHHSRIK